MLNIYVYKYLKLGEDILVIVNKNVKSESKI